MKYTNLFIDFINGANTIAISGVKDFSMMKSLLKKVGLDMLCGDYYALLELARHNRCAITETTVLLEYQPQKGLTIGYNTYDESEKCYGIKP